MSSMSKIFLEVTLSEETELNMAEKVDNREEVFNRPLEEDLMDLTLVSEDQDDDHSRLFRKKPRAKKVRDKWNQLVFVPMAVLNSRDLTIGGKAGKREGFNTFNRFLPLFFR